MVKLGYEILHFVLNDRVIVKLQNFTTLYDWNTFCKDFGLFRLKRHVIMKFKIFN